MKASKHACLKIRKSDIMNSVNGRRCPIMWSRSFSSYSDCGAGWICIPQNQLIIFWESNIYGHRERWYGVAKLQSCKINRLIFSYYTLFFSTIYPQFFQKSLQLCNFVHHLNDNPFIFRNLLVLLRLLQSCCKVVAKFLVASLCNSLWLFFASADFYRSKPGLSYGQARGFIRWNSFPLIKALQAQGCDRKKERKEIL